MIEQIIDPLYERLSKLMDGADNRMTLDSFNRSTPPIPLEFKVIDEIWRRKYLSVEAAAIVFNPVYNTIVEQMEVDWIKSMIGETQYNRKGYFTQYLQVLGDGELTEERVMKFCYLINHFVQQGVFIVGSLVPPAKFDFANGNWAMVFFAAARVFEVKELKAKYGNVFCAEGELATVHIDDLGDKEWEKWKVNFDKKVETNFPDPNTPQIVKEAMTGWLEMKEREIDLNKEK